MKRVTVMMTDECHYITKLFATIINTSVSDLMNTAAKQYIMQHPKFRKFESDFLQKKLDNCESKLN